MFPQSLSYNRSFWRHSFFDIIVCVWDDLHHFFECLLNLIVLFLNVAILCHFEYLLGEACCQT